MHLDSISVHRRFHEFGPDLKGTTTPPLPPQFQPASHWNPQSRHALFESAHQITIRSYLEPTARDHQQHQNRPVSTFGTAWHSDRYPQHRSVLGKLLRKYVSLKVWVNIFCFFIFWLKYGLSGQIVIYGEIGQIGLILKCRQGTRKSYGVRRKRHRIVNRSCLLLGWVIWMTTLTLEDAVFVVQWFNPM